MSLICSSPKLSAPSSASANFPKDRRAFEAPLVDSCFPSFLLALFIESNPNSSKSSPLLTTVDVPGFGHPGNGGIALEFAQRDMSITSPFYSLSRRTLGQWGERIDR